VDRGQLRHRTFWACIRLSQRANIDGSFLLPPKTATAWHWNDFQYIAYFVFPSLGLLAIGKGIVTPANSGFLGDQMPVHTCVPQPDPDLLPDSG
jgi:hypothetical protein